MKQVDQAQLWADYQANRTTENRNRLVVSYLGLVIGTVRRVGGRFPAKVSRDDLHSAGTLGLIQAVERYRPSDRVAFKNFAHWRINGAILDFTRSEDHKGYGREYRRKLRKWRQAEQLVTAHLCGPATQEQIEAAADPVTGGWEKVTKMAEKKHLPLSVSIPDARHLGTVEAVDSNDEFEHMLSLVGKRERAMLSLYFKDGLTHQEIADRLGLCGATISIGISQSISKLRDKLAA